MTSFSSYEQVNQADSLFFDNIPMWQQYNISPKCSFESIFILQIAEKKKKKTIQMHQNYIYYSKHKRLNFENAYLDIYIKAKEPYGFKLTKSAQTLEVYGTEVHLWLPNLRRFALQTDFVSRYKVLKKIGQGHAANVYRIRHKQEDLEFAAKIFEKKVIQLEENELEAITIEIKCHRLVTHENVAQLIEVYENKSHLIMIQELFLGGEIQHLLDIRGLPEEMAQRLIKPLFQAVAHIHSLGMFHRDIKPQNIMLRKIDAFESIGLIDFGLADHWNKDANYLFHRCGTPGYVAPELLRDQKYDLKIDVYSLGLILFLILSGHEPFESADYNSMVTKNYHGLVPYNNLKLSENCMNFLKKVLSFEPQLRLSAKEALLHPFLKNGPGNQIHRQMHSLANLNSMRKTHQSINGKLKTENSADTKFSPNKSPQIPFGKRGSMPQKGNNFQIRKGFFLTKS